MKKIKYTKLDELAYESYLKAVGNNSKYLDVDAIYINPRYVNNFEKFVKRHRQNEINLGHYYNINKQKYRKLKLEKLNERGR